MDRVDGVVALVADARGGGPALADVLQVEDAGVCEAVQVERQLGVLLDVVGLAEGSDEHPLGSYDQGNALVWVLFELEEASKLGVSVLESFSGHLARTESEDTMWEQEFVNESDTLLSSLSISIVNSGVVPSSKSDILPQPLGLLLGEGSLVLDH